MKQDYENNEEKLKAENEFLKMKMMLEQGAVFGTGTEKQIFPTMENDFLQYIVAFEKQTANPKYINVYDKIKRPTHFKPVDEIAEQDIESAWKALAGYMNKHDVSLGVCSPNISERELYRFTTEELFNYNTKYTACNVGINISTVTSVCEVTATTANKTIQLSGTWRVSFEKDEDLGYGYINAADIEGINF